MTTIRVPYGDGWQEAQIPDGVSVQVIDPACEPVETPVEELIEEALDHPIGTPRLDEMVSKQDKVAIIVNDHTRPGPNAQLVDALMKRLEAAGMADEQICFVIATGSHRASTTAELDKILGEKYRKRIRVRNHDCRDGDHVNIGTTQSGMPVWIDREVAESSFIITTGLINPHATAGFSGGRKSILPGVSGEATILRNHNPHNIADRHSRGACLEGNLIHQECCEAARLAGLGFILNVALNERKQIVAAFAGDPAEAHERGCEYVKNTMSVPVRRTDIVITTNNGYPLDRNLYQVVKGIEVAGQAVKKGGVIVIAAECRDGIGHEGFSRLLASCCSPEELYEKMSAYPVEVDKWQVQILARVLKDTHVILVNRSIDTEVLKSIFLEQAPDLDAGLAMAMRLTGPEAAVSIMPEGPVMIPVAED